MTVFIYSIFSEELGNIVRDFRDVADIPGVCGAIDGTHMKVRAPTENEWAYINRKGEHSLNVQVCMIVLSEVKFRILINFTIIYVANRKGFRSKLIASCLCLIYILFTLYIFADCV